MRGVWEDALLHVGPLPNGTRLDTAEFKLVPPVRVDPGGEGPVPHTTGLGLPLSRALSKAMGGWLGLEANLPGGVTPERARYSRVTDALSTPNLSGTGTPTPPVRDMTYFWCVLEAPRAELPPLVSDTVVSLVKLEASESRRRQLSAHNVALLQDDTPIRRVNMSPGGILKSTSPLDRSFTRGTPAGTAAPSPFGGAPLTGSSAEGSTHGHGLSHGHGGTGPPGCTDSSDNPTAMSMFSPGPTSVQHPVVSPESASRIQVGFQTPGTHLSGTHMYRGVCFCVTLVHSAW
jgi:hypothetical protein